MSLRVFTAAALAVCLSSSLFAEQVKVTGVHLCCGKCLKGVSTALTGVKGVSDAKCDKDNETVTFEAADADAAKAGVSALAKAGYYGAATMGDAKVGYPDTGIAKDAKSNKVTITGVHLCCGSCITSAEGALEAVKGVSKLSSDGPSGTISVEGTDVNHQALINALHGAGFHGSVK